MLVSTSATGMTGTRETARGRVLPGLVAVAVLAAGWQMAFLVSEGNAVLLPSLVDIANSLYRLVVVRSVMPDVAFTLVGMLVGLSIATVLGLLLGLAVGSWRPLYNAVSPLIDFGRSVPVTMLYPLFVLTLGVGQASKIGMVAVAALWIIALNAAYGAQLVSPTKLAMARLYGATPGQIFTTVRVPGALIQTVIGLRVALSYAFVVEILAEMFMGGEFGLGQRVTEAYTTYRIADLYGLVVISGLIGLLLNRAFVLLERRFVTS